MEDKAKTNFKAKKQKSNMKGILYKKSMVESILEGRKTKTRRIVKELPKSLKKMDGQWLDQDGNAIPCPYTVGEVFYVKETFYAYGFWKFVYENGKKVWSFNECTLDDGVNGFAYAYESNRPSVVKKMKSGAVGWYKRPSLFMPERASRIKIEVTDINAEPLHLISEEDAIAEGVDVMPDGRYKQYSNFIEHNEGLESARVSFFTLWGTIHGLDSWATKPYVWVITFKQIKNT